MYNQEEIMNQYHAPLETATSSIASMDGTQLDGMVLSSPTMDYTTSVASYNPQQQYIPDLSDNTYCSFPAPQFPQTWLPSEPTPMDAAQQLYAMTQSETVPMTPLPSLRHSMSKSSSDGATSAASGEHSPVKDEVDQKKKEKKERRRAQNRVAQRLFRARREVSLKESSQRLETLEEEVGRLQSNNDGLSDTISRLRDEIERLRRENVSLKQRLSDPVNEEIEILQVSAPSIFLDSDRDTVGGVKGNLGPSKDMGRAVSDSSNSSSSSTRQTRSRRQRIPEVNKAEEISAKFL